MPQEIPPRGGSAVNDASAKHRTPPGAASAGASATPQATADPGAAPAATVPRPAPMTPSASPAPYADGPRVSRPPSPGKPAVAPPPAGPAATAPSPLDLGSLETRLRETKAISTFTKLALKNQLDDLIERLRAFYRGQLETSLAELRRAFDLLVMKVLALLQDTDPPLARSLMLSRESIWGVLSEPAKLDKL